MLVASIYVYSTEIAFAYSGEIYIYSCINTNMLFNCCFCGTMCRLKPRRMHMIMVLILMSLMLASVLADPGTT